MIARSVTRAATAARLHGGVALRAVSIVPPSMCLRSSVASPNDTSSLLVSCHLPHASLCTAKRLEHTAAPATPPAAPAASSDDLSTQLNDLMDSFAEARELIKDAMESVGTTYFTDDMEDAESQTKDVLKRWADVQAFLESKGEKEELQKLRNMHDLKIKQMEAELETVRDAGGSG